jgi:hypothetical protein
MSGHKCKIGQAVIFFGRERPQALTRLCNSCLPKAEIFNIASETLTSRTTALSEKAISIASHEQDKD